jgi:ribosome-associated protein
LSLEGADKALAVARLALDKKASGVVVLRMEGLVTFTEYFVICSGGNTQHVRAIVDHIEEALSREKINPLGIEGRSYGHWVLMDYNDVVAHVFDEETRQYYELEKLWLDAPRVPLDEDTDTLAGKDKRQKRG